MAKLSCANIRGGGHMMASDVWKEYESNEISHSVAHHLTAIHELMGDLGYARVSDVARALEITRGSASLTLKALKARRAGCGRSQ